VSAILIHDTLQTTFPLADAVINEAPWQCAPLQHNRVLQLINSVRTSCRDPPDVKPTRWGTCPTQRMRYSHVADTRQCFTQCTMAHRPAAESTRGAL